MRNEIFFIGLSVLLLCGNIESKNNLKRSAYDGEAFTNDISSSVNYNVIEPGDLAHEISINNFTTDSRENSIIENEITLSTISDRKATVVADDETTTTPTSEETTSSVDTTETTSSVDTTGTELASTSEETTTEITTTTEEPTTPEPVCELSNTTQEINESTNILTVNWEINNESLCQNKFISILLTNKNCLERCTNPNKTECFACFMEKPKENSTNLKLTFDEKLIPCSTYVYSLKLFDSTTTSSTLTSDEFNAVKEYKEVTNVIIEDYEAAEIERKLIMKISWEYEYVDCNENFKVFVNGDGINYESTNNSPVEFDKLAACDEYNVTIQTSNQTDLIVSHLYKTKRINPLPIKDFNVYQDNEKGLIKINWNKTDFGDKCIKKFIINVSNEYEDDYSLTVQPPSYSEVIANVIACATYKITLTTCSTDLCDDSLSNPPTSISTYPQSTTISPTNFIELTSDYSSSTLTSTSFPTTITRRRTSFTESESESIETTSIYGEIEASITQTIRTEPRPFGQPQQPQPVSSSENTLTFTVVPGSDNKTKCIIKKYHILCTDNNIERQGSSDNSTVQVCGLEPYHNYSCSAAVENEKGEMSPLSSTMTYLTKEGEPDKPNVTYDLETVTSTSFIVNWTAPNNTRGLLIEYRVHVIFSKFLYYYPSYCNKTNPPDDKHIIKVEKPQENNSYTFTRGEPYCRYSVQVQANNQERQGQFSTAINISTLEDQASEVNDFTIDTNVVIPNKPYDRNITVHFKTPCQANGRIQNFSVVFNPIESNYSLEPLKYIIPYDDRDKFSLTVSDLMPDIEYKVTAFAQSEKYVGKERSKNFQLTPGIPERKKGLENLITSETSTTSVFITIPDNIFDSNVGHITEIKILVGQSECQTLIPRSGFRNESSKVTNWGAAMKEECIPLYDTNIRLSRGLHQKESIGSEAQCDNCNGPLRPGTIYGLTFRLYTETGFTDTEYIRIVTNKEVPVIAILITILSILCIVFSIGFYISCRRTRDLRKTALDSPYDRKDISTQNFHSYHSVMTNNDNEKIKEEYKAIQFFSDNLDKTFIASKANERLNRYMNIYPYDSNRVVLNDDEFENDYINASYINGYYYPKEYIAAQGPKPNSAIDFWRMVIQHRVESIVMLTSLVENNKVKCHEYFPKLHGRISYGNIKIICVEEQSFPTYIKRIFKVEKDDMKLKINHYYFCKWPDHGCPNNAIDLIEFVRVVRNERQKPGESFIVHCSAGVGRTGTFIALDIMMQRIKKEGKINIFDLVKQLRIQRMKMVQTCDQYLFLYRSALELVTMPRNANVLHNIRDTILKYINEFEMPRNLSYFRDAFRTNDRANIVRADQKETAM